ncbi:arginase [Starmerella bacillaris]|mgnify:FL=1|uniref:Arginase n=1 Tax=Starmerella bacillaris TaxID=1247836 RepID=A0AAV5RMH5_STABA|nr:arginase [Starmerella bacillaris]
MVSLSALYFVCSTLLSGSHAFEIEDVDVLNEKWGSDWNFAGITTFARLPTNRCLVDFNTTYDVAVVGVPFDTAVSYRPGARFGPRAIRAASMRQNKLRGFNARAGFNPYQNWAHVVDCMDISVTPMDNVLALHQMTEAFHNLLAHNTTHPEFGKVPRLVALGGDHSVVLPHLRALHSIYGEITVIHFDAHLDTWLPNKYPEGWDSSLGSGIGEFTHGSMFWMASEEGLLSKNCIHAGLRTRLSGTDYEDYRDDKEQGFLRITCDDIDDFKPAGIIEIIKKRVPEGAPVYISVDIDVIDPSAAPGTGTPEVGGWSTRELIRLLRGLGDLNLVGADIVEVSPAYDHAENTAMAGMQVAYELLTSMVMNRAKEGVHLDPSREELGLPASSYSEFKQVSKDEDHSEL